MSRLLTVSPSPHEHGKETSQKLMFGVVIALVPAFLASLFYFGYGALIVTSVSILSCLLFEYLIQRFVLKKPVSITDGSALVTGLLLAFNVPSNLPIHIIIIGAFFSIAIAKMTFGGLGNNPFNPALAGRVFLLISFPVQMTSWPVPQGFATRYVDAVTGATPLAIIKEGLKGGDNVTQVLDQLPSLMKMFVGQMGGSMGEITAFALLLGGAYMLIRKIITWHIPVSILGTVALFTGILWLINPELYVNPMVHLLSGGILLGAIFMATDYVTSPMNHKAQIIFGVGIGIITVVIRVWGAYPEGVSFAILIMNAFVPLLNRYVKPKPFGEEVKNG